MLNKTFKRKKIKPRNLWREVNFQKYQAHVTVSSINSTTNANMEEIDDRVIYMEELEKRKEVYGICGKCNEPGTGYYWCQPCNAKRFKKNFKNWTSGNKDIDEGGFGKIYSAEWSEGHVGYWDIESQKWFRYGKVNNVVLKRLDNSFEISTDLLNEIKSYLQIYIWNIVQCYGITQDPNTKDYMMVLRYCKDENLRDYYLNKNDCTHVILCLLDIATGLLDIHNADKVHKDFYSGNILCSTEVIRGYQYTKASDIYSFGIVINEFLSEEIPFNNIPHDYKTRINNLKIQTNRNNSENIKNHPQAIYTSRLLNFKNLPEPVNSSVLSSFQVNTEAVLSVSTNLISECFDIQLNESDLNEINQEENIES
ncbi:hypothetical protein RclHR1_10680010 [Rhizophagus clarus]|uniref:Protein kinase domain-containing protein n=1 Tax=Rhizophagus clarus TaxID=94130 RepID=A0A2Z6QUZ7_9GLOM|nr:hypothetical protein RclHR1_10680010 [Rhizophagus clarus]